MALSGRVLGIAGVLALVTFGLSGALTPADGQSGQRAAYLYDYMPADHLDSLAAAGFDVALVHWIPDSLDASGLARLHALVTRGAAVGVEVVPEWLAQQTTRLAARNPARRYVWGRGMREPKAACPLDSAYWRSALFDRANEILSAEPGIRKLAVDLELLGAGRHHYDAGPCRCASCVAEYTHGNTQLMARDPLKLTGLLPYEEARLTHIFRALLVEFAASHPGVQLGVLDLDGPFFVHRALGRALAQSAVPAIDYTERSYSTGAAGLAGVRLQLDGLGLTAAPVVGGLWLKRYTPDQLAHTIRDVRAAGGGYFVFTTYSLWQSPARLDGPYLLQAPAGDYWRALRIANGTTP